MGKNDQQQQVLTVRVSDLQRERLGRLRAEWEAAAAHAEVTKLRLEAEIAGLARTLGVQHRFEVDFERGLFVVPDEKGAGDE